MKTVKISPEKGSYNRYIIERFKAHLKQVSCYKPIRVIIQ